MKKKPPVPVPDIEAMLEAVARDHIPGRTDGMRPISPPIGARKKAAGCPGGEAGRNGLLAALQEAAGSKGPDPVPAEDADPEAADAPNGEPAPDEATALPRTGREERQAARLRAEKAALQAELDLSKKEKGTLRAELQKTVRQRDAAEKEIGVEKARHAASAHDLFDRWRRTVGLEFESAKRKAAIENAMAANADAFTLADRALAAQAAANAKYGTVQALREEFERMDRLTDALRFAEKESLYPVPELRKAIVALESRRRKLLDNPEIAALMAPADPGAVVLSLRSIEELSDGKEALPGIDRFLSVVASLKATGLVDDGGTGRIRRILEEKIRRIIRAEASRSAGRPGFREETFEALVLEGGAARFTLLVDGNNVLVTNESVFGDGGVIPDFTGKRIRLNQALEKISPAFRHLLAVYDGNEDRTEPTGGRFTVVFTEKRHQVADDWIVARVSAEKKESCILATDDAGLIARCPDLHAVIGSRHLYDFLAGQGVLRR